MTETKKRKTDFNEVKEDNIYNFDLRLHLNQVNGYLNNIEDQEKVYKQIIKKKKENNLKDTENEIVEQKEDINKLQHNIRFNLHQLNKIVKQLKASQENLEIYKQNLCDHDIYSECQYHNDRYYYCNKCSWQN